MKKENLIMVRIQDGIMMNHILYHWLKQYHPHILHVTPLEYMLKNKK